MSRGKGKIEQITSAMQLKDRARNLAHEVGVSPEAILCGYMTGRFLVRLAHSRYKRNFVIKGGALVSSMIGIAKRTTMDLDTTARGVSIDMRTLSGIVNEIAAQELNDGIIFEIGRLESIMEGSEYPGFRIFIKARLERIVIPFSIDVTTGAPITPDAILTDVKLPIENKSVKVYAYPLEMILAEKLEAIVYLGPRNGRMRDFYDIHELLVLKGGEIDLSVLKTALTKTIAQRKHENAFVNAAEFIDRLLDYPNLILRWKNYCRTFDYAKDLAWKDVAGTVRMLFNKLGKLNRT